MFDSSKWKKIVQSSYWYYRYFPNILAETNFQDQLMQFSLLGTLFRSGTKCDASHMQYSPISPGSGSSHCRVAGSGLQVMLVHTALICVLGTNPGLQL